MAPIPSSILPPPPRTADAAWDTVPHASSAFSAKTFLEICAGTVIIFIISVLCWKSSAFIRFFSRKKVVSGGKRAAARYIKTWHGWAPLEEHEKRKARRRAFFDRLRQNLIWRSSHADYDRVWWDAADGKSSQQQRKHRDDASQLPPYFGEYPDSNAGITSNPCRPAPVSLPPVRPPKAACKERLSPAKEQRGSSASGTSMLAEGNGVLGRARGSKILGLSQKKLLMDDLRWISRPPLTQRLENKQQPNVVTQSGCDGPMVEPREGGDIHFQDRVSLWQSHLPPSKSASHLPLLPDTGRLTPSTCLQRRRCVSDDLIQMQTTGNRWLPNPNHFSQNISEAGDRPPTQHSSYLVWKRKVWAARMQRKGLVDTAFDLRGLAGRPGTLASDVLNSMVSSPSPSEHCNAVLKDVHRKCKQSSSICGGHLQVSPHIHTALDSFQKEGLGRPLHTLNPIPGRDGAKALRIRGRSSALLQDIPKSNKHQRSMSEPLPPHDGFTELVRKAHGRKRHTSSESDPGVVDRIPLTSPEIRLIDDLDRKLEWFSSELEPGRRHPNFLLLHNHWLNGNTWRTYDPVSRVPSDRRRQNGDPRFNDLKQEPSTKSQQKYPARNRPKAKTPQLDSWRLAVNRARKSSGLRRFLRDVELFEGSADEPREGDIDTAAWVLRRPPQGFGITDKERNTYYEGTGGWSEKLSEWEQVGSGYRLRKAICEGRGNRNRAVEVAKSVGGGCKAAARKVTPVWASKAKHGIDPENKRRKERSGYGSSPRRRRGENGETPPTQNSVPTLLAAAEQADSLPSSSSTSQQDVSSDQGTTERSNIVIPDPKPLSSLDLATLCFTLDLASMTEKSLPQDGHHVGRIDHAATGPCC